jgi:hypothetical protein
MCGLVQAVCVGWMDSVFFFWMRVSRSIGAVERLRRQIQFNICVLPFFIAYSREMQAKSILKRDSHVRAAETFRLVFERLTSFFFSLLRERGKKKEFFQSRRTPNERPRSR